MTGSPQYIHADELLARVLAGNERESTIANDLLKEIGRGYPVERLSTLLQSDNEQAIEDGIWIASELGAGARPILSYLLPLYDYPNRRIKYYAVELALTAATEHEGEVIAHALKLIRDPERPVRRVSFELLTRADSGRLAASLSYIGDEEIKELLEWILEVESDSRDNDEIALWLRGSDGLRWLFAAVAAARVYQRNPHYLQLAASLREGYAQSLAASELAWFSKSQEKAQRRRKRAESSDD